MFGKKAVTDFDENWQNVVVAGKSFFMAIMMQCCYVVLLINDLAQFDIRISS